MIGFTLPVVVTILAIVIVLIPLMTKVWQEGEERDLGQQVEILKHRKKTWVSKRASLEIAIANLTRHERLESYAIDTFLLQEPNPKRVISIPRKTNGAIIEDKRDGEFVRFIKNLMGTGIVE